MSDNPDAANEEIATAILKTPAALSRAALRADPRVARDGVDYMATGAIQIGAKPAPCPGASKAECAPPQRATSAEKFLSKVKSALRSTLR